jgi:hypothetical protein
MTVLNQAQRYREFAIAQRMVDLLVANCRSATEIVPQEILAHFFGLACQEADYIVDEGSARRILHACAGQLKERRRVADQLNSFLLTSTEELLEMQREVKEAQRAAKRARQ